MNDEQLLRYSRQIMLPQVDAVGQQRLAKARVLVIGAGGLGSPVAIYLAAAGVGTLAISDHDQVELSNLQRQPLHATPDIGLSKVASASNHLAALNPDCRVIAIDHKLAGDELSEQVDLADVVVDASDNFATRFLVNAACQAGKTPLVAGAAIRFEGQVAVFDPRRVDAPCYRCLYSDQGEEELRCSENGVLAPVVGIIGSIQATETLKLLIDIGEPLTGRLLVMDALTMEWRSMRLRKDPNCPVCGTPASAAKE